MSAMPILDAYSQRNCKPRIFAQPTPNQIRNKKIVTIDIPVDMTITDGCVYRKLKSGRNDVFRHGIRALTQLWCSRGHVAPIRRA
jgi:hypothetical protein